MNWLSKIEALKPGDACEFQYTSRGPWFPGTVIQNGGPWYWRIRDDSNVEDREVQVHIECVRLPGQTEAWSRLT